MDFGDGFQNKLRLENIFTKGLTFCLGTVYLWTVRLIFELREGVRVHITFIR
jgi:hypothetical protein